MIDRLNGIRKDFKNIAFIGPSPYFFLQNMPFKNVEKFTYMENSEKAVERSHEIITNMVQNDAMKDTQPDEIEPKVLCDENEWVQTFGEEEQFDLVVSNMNLHWNNKVEASLKNYH